MTFSRFYYIFATDCCPYTILRTGNCKLGPIIPGNKKVMSKYYPKNIKLQKGHMETQPGILKMMKHIYLI